MGIIYDSNNNNSRSDEVIENKDRQALEEKKEFVQNTSTPATKINPLFDTTIDEKPSGLDQPEIKIEDIPEELKKFSPAIAKLVKTYEQYYISKQLDVEESTLYVDEIASKVALFYEKVRKVVDWKEEHLVRRAAIERVLKRKMLSEMAGAGLVSGFDSEKIAEPMILELIRGGHFENGKIPRKRVSDVRKILDKYAYILKHNPLNRPKDIAPKIKKQVNLYNWILEVAACEIEETLDPPIREKALIDCMTTLMNERIKLTPRKFLSDEEKEIQVHLAVHRTLYHLDEPIMSYHLLKKFYPNWHDLNPEELHNMGNGILSLIKRVEETLESPHAGNFFNICEKYDTLYLLIGDALDSFAKKPAMMTKAIKKSKDFLTYIQEAYDKRLSTLKKRLTRSAIYSTLSIFVAGGVSLFIFEVPLAKLVYGEWKFMAIVADIMLPTVLMGILVALVRPPGKDNYENVKKGVIKVLYHPNEKDEYEIKHRKKKKVISNFIISIFYLAATFASLYFVYWVFSLADVPVTSLYIDTLNVAMIVSAAVVIKQRSKELTVEEKTSFFEFLIDILSVPMAKIGQWFSNKWKEYNIVSVFFIALVDMPFSTFVEFIESWRSFLKEKKAEVH